MQFSLLFSALLSLAAADTASDLSNVATKANDLSSALEGWDGDLSSIEDVAALFAPFTEALEQIHEYFPSVQDLTDDLTADAASFVDVINAFTSLLNALAPKATALAAATSNADVKTEITDLGGPLADVIGDFIALAGTQQAKDLFEDSINALVAGFTAALAAFGASGLAFPFL